MIRQSCRQDEGFCMAYMDLYYAMLYGQEPRYDRVGARLCENSLVGLGILALMILYCVTGLYLGLLRDWSHSEQVLYILTYLGSRFDFTQACIRRSLPVEKANHDTNEAFE